MTAGQVAFVLGGAVVILAIAAVVLYRAYRPEDPGKVSPGWLSVRRRDDHEDGGR